MNFYAAILILKMEENAQHFQCIMLHYFKEGKNTNETHKKWFVRCVEKMLWLSKCVKRGFQSFMLEISHWMMLRGWVSQLKLIGIKIRH